MKYYKAFIIVFLFIFLAETAFAGDLDIQHYFDEGNTYFNEGQYNKAIESYSRLVAIYPDFIQGYYNRGLAYYKAGKYDEAVADYSRVISSSADANAELYSNRAIAYLKKGDYENAVKDYSTVISINPRLPEAYHNRGIAYANTGKYDEAIEDYNRVISMKPKNLNVYLSRGVAYTRKRWLTSGRHAMRAANLPAIISSSFQSDALVLECTLIHAGNNMRRVMSGDIVSFSHVRACGVRFSVDLTNRVLTECL